jgi:acetyl-CoA synthetase
MLKIPTWVAWKNFSLCINNRLKVPNHFFAKLAKDNLSWSKDFDETHNGKFSDTSWFSGGELNVSYNCIDRHLKNSAQKTAIIWEGDEIGDSKEITFQELHDEVCKFANVLKNLGAKKGSRVCIYMPMIPEVAYAMLACTRIGAIHSVVFGGFFTRIA